MLFEGIGVLTGIHAYVSSCVGEMFWVIVNVVCVNTFNDLEGDIPGCFWVILAVFTLSFVGKKNLLFSCLPAFYSL